MILGLTASIPRAAAKWLMLSLCGVAIASETDTDDRKQQFPLTLSDDSADNCEITIVRVIEATEYRGSGPITPAIQEQLDADPEFAETYFELDHGDHHILCRYEVRLGSTPNIDYEWQEYHQNTTRELTAEICYADSRGVAEHILSSTRGCTDLDAGAYWGLALERLR